MNFNWNKMVSRRKVLLVFCAASGAFSLLCVWSYFIRMEKFYWEASKWFGTKTKLTNKRMHTNTHPHTKHLKSIEPFLNRFLETTENAMYNHEAAALKSHHSRDITNSFDDNLIVIYNRVPKTGSTSFVNLAYDLCRKNHFYVLHINITANMHVLSLNNQVRICQVLWCGYRWIWKKKDCVANYFD